MQASCLVRHRPLVVFGRDCVVAGFQAGLEIGWWILRSHGYEMRTARTYKNVARCGRLILICKPLLSILSFASESLAASRNRHRNICLAYGSALDIQVDAYLRVDPVVSNHCTDGFVIVQTCAQILETCVRDEVGLILLSLQQVARKRQGRSVCRLPLSDKLYQSCSWCDGFNPRDVS